MPARKFTDAEFVRAWEATGGSPIRVSEILGVDIRTVYKQRDRIERHTGKHLPSTATDHPGRGDHGQQPNDYLQRHSIDGFTGVVVVFSDAHWWPNKEPSVAHKALVHVIKELKPKLIIGNGDLLDGARISRHPKSGWENPPRLKDELEETKERLAEIRHAYSRAQCLRTIGNHDQRFDRYLAMNASELEDVAGARLADHLPAWKECVSVVINQNTIVKHRIYGGIHSGYRNTLNAGWNTVTGHTHLLEVKPWSDYRGRRYGVSTGAIADIDGPQFFYAEDNPRPWCSGFAVLTFDDDGRLLYPELAESIGGRCFFRGQVVVDGRKKAGKNGGNPA